MSSTTQIIQLTMESSSGGGGGGEVRGECRSRAVREPSRARGVEERLQQLNSQIQQAEKMVLSQAERLWEVGSDFLLHHQHLPEWLRDNDYLLAGHRPQLACAWSCLKSMFVLHSETLNIWTHGLGCLLFFWLMFADITNDSNRLEEKIWFGILHASTALCLLFSWINHTFCCHSQDVCKTLGRIDFAGIALMITGSFVTWIYYSLYCQESLVQFYVTCVLIIGTSIILVMQIEKYSSPDRRAFRSSLYSMFAMLGIFPMGHYTLFYASFSHWVIYEMVGWLGALGINFFLAGLVYAMRVPERYYPGRFDIWVRGEIRHTVPRSQDHRTVYVSVPQPPDHARVDHHRSVDAVRRSSANGKLPRNGHTVPP